MVTTRRKSGILTAVSYKEELAYDSEEDYVYSDPLEEGESDSGGPLSARPKKRARTSTAPPTTGKSAKRPVKPQTGKPKKVARRELMKTFFGVLPLDIVFEIFGYLHPRDLLRLSRLNKSLRKVLASKSSASVWRSARLSTGDLPDCPPDQSELQWAQLLFEGDCTICWKNGKVRKIDWALRLRGCEWCLKGSLVYHNRAAKSFPEVEADELADALELLPYSHTGGWAHGHASKSRFYYSPAVRTMLEKLEELNLRVLAGVDNATEELEAFKTKTKAEAQMIVKNASEVERWALVHNSEKASFNDQLVEKRKEAIKEKLFALGYDIRDIEPVLCSVDKPKELTDRGWKSIQAQYESLVENTKTLRLARERRNLLDSRRGIVDGIYQAYKAQATSTFDPITPKQSATIYKLLPFAEIIESSNDTVITKESFNAAVAALPVLLEAWRVSKKLLLLDVLAPSLGLELSGMTEHQKKEKLRRIHLARAVFICDVPSWNRPGSPAVFVDNIHRHSCTGQVSYDYLKAEYKDGWSFECLSPDPVARQTVDALVACLGIDPMSAKPADMDTINARFICKTCPNSRLARSWRNCVVHHREHPNRSEVPVWSRLNDRDTIAIINQENSFSNNPDATERMVCHHCNNPDMLVRTSHLKQHMQLCHNKEVEASDFHPDPTIPAPPTALKKANPTAGSQSQASTDSNKVYLCKQCPRSQRRFILEGVRSHIAAVHKISNPTAQHYTDTRKTLGV